MALVPTDFSDTSTIPAITALDVDGFSELVPQFLLLIKNWVVDRKPGKDMPSFLKALKPLIISRAAEPATVTALSTAINPPYDGKDEAYLGVVGMGDIIMQLPLEAIEPYRPLLERMATCEPLANFAFLKCQAEDTLLFLNNPDKVWVHRSKGDRMAARTLAERIKTPEQLRPHVPELLNWLGDLNWPPHGACWGALARFPEVTVGPIGELIEREKGDGGWIVNVLEFVESCVPIGELWEELRPQLERLANHPEGDEDEWEVPELAHGLIAKLDAWKAQQGQVSA